MGSLAPTGSVWPTESQRLLLRAALLPGADGLEAWRTWTSRHDLVESPLDRGSLRLLPLVSRALAASDADEPALGRLRGTYRYAWSANQQVLKVAAPALRTLHEARVDTLILRGAALATLHYREMGARPFFDVDVLVRPAQAAGALDALAGAGWHPGAVSERVSGSGRGWPGSDARGGAVSERVPGSQRGWPGLEVRGSVSLVLRFGHAVRVRRDAGQELALHWHAFPDCPRDRADDRLWARAIALSLAGVETRALDATESLLHTLVDGLRWHPEPRIRWVADATATLRAAGDRIDWDRFLDEAAARRLELRAASALAYLRDAVDAPVPAPVLRRLSARAPSRRERAAYRAAALSPADRRHRVLGAVPSALAEYRRVTANLSLADTVAAFPDFLRYACAAPERAPLLPLLLRQVGRTTRRLLALAPAISRST